MERFDFYAGIALVVMLLKEDENFVDSALDIAQIMESIQKRRYPPQRSILQLNAYDYLCSHPMAPSYFRQKNGFGHDSSRNKLKARMGIMTVEQFVRSPSKRIKKQIGNVGVGEKSIIEAQGFLKKIINGEDVYATD